jgi:hypothetical protein
MKGALAELDAPSVAEKGWAPFVADKGMVNEQK